METDFWFYFVYELYINGPITHNLAIINFSITKIGANSFQPGYTWYFWENAYRPMKILLGQVT